VQRRDLVFVTDVVRALIAASTHDRAAGRVINIGTGRGVALRDAARFVWEKCGAEPAKLEIGAIGKSGDDPFDTLADNSLAAELLDWHPLVSFEDGISQMIDAELTSTEAQRQI